MNIVQYDPGKTANETIIFRSFNDHSTAELEICKNEIEGRVYALSIQFLGLHPKDGLTRFGVKINNQILQTKKGENILFANCKKIEFTPIDSNYIKVVDDTGTKKDTAWIDLSKSPYRISHKLPEIIE